METLKHVALTEDQFDELFHKKINHLIKDAAFDGSMYETYGDEFDFVAWAMNQPIGKHLWTIVEGDDSNDNIYYLSGYHFVNCLGFFFTEEPVTDGEEIEVIIEINMDK